MSDNNTEQGKRFVKVIKPYLTIGGKFICYHDKCVYKTLISNRTDDEQRYYCPFKDCIFREKKAVDNEKWL